MRKLLYIAILCFSAFAQSKVRSHGHVLSRIGEPIHGARIVATNLATHQAITTESDPAGRFVLEVPSPGDYSITINREGFFLHSEKLWHIEPGGRDLQITLESIHELQTSLDVKEPPGSFDMDRTTTSSTLSSRTLYDIPFPNQNSLRSGMRLIPGLTQDSRGGIHVYGGAEDQVNHSFEGFQINDPLTGRLDARMSLEAIEVVEVTPGRPGPEFGRGSAGSLALRARRGDDQFRFSATNVLPGFDTQRGTRIGTYTPRANFSGPYRHGKAWFFNTVEFQYIPTLVPELPRGQDRSKTFRFNDLLHNQINLSPRNILTIGTLTNYVNSPRNGLTFLDPRETTVDRRSRSLLAYAKDQHFFSRGATLEFGLASSWTETRERPQGTSPYVISPMGRRGNSFANFDRTATRSQAILNSYLPVFEFWGTHLFKAGADFLHLGIDQRIRRSDILYARADGTLLRSIQFAGPEFLSSRNQESSVYVQDSWRLRPGLLLELAGRFEKNWILHSNNFSPRLGFAYSPRLLENTRFSGGWARLYENTNLRLFSRPADQFSLTTWYDPQGLPLGLPGLTAYRLGTLRGLAPYSDNFNFTIDQTLAHRLSARAQWTRRRGEQGLNYFNTLFPGTVLNGTPYEALYQLRPDRRDRYQSLELQLRQTIRSQYEWLASYTRSSARSTAVIDRTVDDPTIYTSSGGPMPWDAPHRFLGWAYVPTPFRNWAVASMVEYHTGFPFSTVDERGQLTGTLNDHRLRHFFELNLFVERRITAFRYRVALRGGLINLTGSQNPTIVNNVLGSPNFLSMYGGQRRAVNFRLRFLGKER